MAAWGLSSVLYVLLCLFLQHMCFRERVRDLGFFTYLMMMIMIIIMFFLPAST